MTQALQEHPCTARCAKRNQTRQTGGLTRVFFLIRAMDQGGAERQLIELVKALDKSRFDVSVATFYDGGALREELERVVGVKVFSLGKKGRWDVMRFSLRLHRLVRRLQPQIIHGYLGVANEFALFAGRSVGARVVWGVRASNVDLSKYDRVAAWSSPAGSMLSRFADLTIANSIAGLKYHVACGYPSSRLMVIHNGIDTERFRADRRCGRAVRREWGIKDHERLIGLVGRLDPMKDHPTFLRAAALLAQQRQDVRFACVGTGQAAYRQQQVDLAAQLGLGSRLIWAGGRNDMSAIHNAIDVATSASSFGEGFPNVVGEAMACGVPCIATDVGDSAFLIEDRDRIVPPGDPVALAAAWGRLLDLSEDQRDAVVRAGRARIVDEFSVQKLAARTEAALLSVLK